MEFATWEQVLWFFREYPWTAWPVFVTCIVNPILLVGYALVQNWRVR